jgi:protein TonB
MKPTVKYIFFLFALFIFKNVAGQNCILTDSTAFAEFVYINTHYTLMDYIQKIEGTAIYQVNTDDAGKINDLQVINISDSSKRVDSEARSLIYKAASTENCSKNSSFTVSVKIKFEDNIIYQYVEEMPEFIGGIAELFKHINKKLPLFPGSGCMRILSRVIVGFIVEKDGSINIVEVLKSADQLLDADAISIVKQMPKWKAG